MGVWLNLGDDLKHVFEKAYQCHMSRLVLVGTQRKMSSCLAEKKNSLHPFTPSPLKYPT